MVYTPFIIPLAVSAIVIVAMLVVAWENRAEETAPWFAASLGALLLWTVGYMFELMATGLNAKIVWANVEYIGTTALPLLWLQVALIYTRRARLGRAAWGALWAFCAALIVTIFVNPGDLFRGDPAVSTHGSLTALAPDYGPLWKFVWIPWMYGLMVVVLVLLVRGMMHAQRIYARQYTALLVATLVPLAAGSLYSIGASPWPDYNPAMAVVSISGLLMAYALFHYRLFDIAPLARDAVIDELADGLVVLDVESRIRDFNAAAGQVFPGLCAEAIGRPADEVLAIHPAMLEGIRDEARAVEAGDDPGEGLVRADVSVSVPEEGGRQREFTLHLTPVRSRGGKVVGHALLLHDVTESVELLGRLEQLASRDELTGLLSRRAWQEEVEHEFVRAARYGYGLGLVLLDVDGLQRVNDVCGQEAGDAVLRALAATCRHALRPFDVLGRLESDQVAALLPHLDALEAQAMGERLRDAVGALNVTCGDDIVHITACVGVASLQGPSGVLLPTLLHEAECALRVAQGEGAGRVACSWLC